jgi:diguanylate cyclase (GGDEF)-like protein
MNLDIWLAFGVAALISFIPVFGLLPTRKHHNYQALLMLSLTVFFWTIVVGLSFVTSSMTFLYYLKLMIYPIVFLMAYFVFLTVMSFTHIEVPKIIKQLAWLFFCLNLLISLTNHIHQWVLKITLLDPIDLDVFLVVETGFFFLAHTIISYVLLFFAFLRLLKYLYKEKSKKRNSLSLYLILVGIVFGLIINIIHVFVYTFYLDPSYIFSVFITFILYYVVYKRDFDLAIITTSRLYILEHMREKYMIFNDENCLISCSSDIIKTYGCVQNASTINECLEKISKKAIIYQTFEEVKKKPLEDKKYYHIQFETFKLQGYKQRGQIVLLYDETKDVKLLYEIDLLKSKDIMTNLYNRNYFEEHRARFEKYDQHLGVIYFDMNALKVINDYFGHKAGDEKLITFANHLILASTRFQDIDIIRLGGDEFLMVIKNANEQMIQQMIDQIKSRCYDDNILSNISFSFGYAIRKSKNESLNEVMRRADELLYDNKRINQAYRQELIDFIISNKL